MIEIEVDMQYLEKVGDLDGVILHDEMGEMESRIFVPECTGQITRGEENNEDYIKEFYTKLCELQDEYGIFINSDYYEHIDYDYDEEPYVCYAGAYTVFVDRYGESLAYIDSDDKEFKFIF